MKVKILEGKTCVNNKQKKAGGSSVDIRQTDSVKGGMSQPHADTQDLEWRCTCVTSPVQNQVDRGKGGITRKSAIRCKR